MDLNTHRGIAEFFARRRIEVANRYQMFGKLPRPLAWLVHTRELQIGAKLRHGRGTPPSSTEVLDAPEATECHCPPWLEQAIGGSDATRVYADSLKQIGAHAHATAFIMFSTVELIKRDPAGVLPDRGGGEGLLCFCESLGMGRQVYLGHIETLPDDAKRVLPWEQVAPESTAAMGGIFVGVVPGVPVTRASCVARDLTWRGDRIR